MDSALYYSLRNEATKVVRAIEAQRALMQAAIVAFGLQLNHHLGLERQIVRVGRMVNGSFHEGEFAKLDNGGLGFYVQLEFAISGGPTVYPTARLRMDYIRDEKVFKLSETETNMHVMVPDTDNMEGAFSSAFALIEPGIRAALYEYYSAY